MWKPGKAVTILLWVLSIISVIICVYIFVKCGALNENNPEEKAEMLSVINPAFIWMYILIILAALVAIVMPLPQLLRNPKSLMRMLFGILGFGVVILIAYSLSSTNALPFAPNHAPVSEDTLKFADVNLYTIYIMFGLTIVTVLFSSVFVNVLKRK